MIKEETIERFKRTVKRLIKKTDYNPSGAHFNILVLDIREKKDRIEYCGYEKQTKWFYGGDLPFIGSPIKVIVHVPCGNRAKLANKPDEKPKKEGEDWFDHYKGDVFLMYSNNAYTDKDEDKPISIFSLGLPVEKIKEIILDSRLRTDIRQINSYGLMPIVLKPIPEIDGVPPETIQPSTTAYLEKIIDKISRTAILEEKAIH